MRTTERRARPLDSTGWLIRAEAEAEPDAPREFLGYAAKFGERTAIGNPATWGFYEEVAPGAFSKTLTEGDARFLVDHDTRMIVSRVSAGDLRLAQDGIGLQVDSELDVEVSYVRDLIRNLERRRITGMSFGFDVIRDSWEFVEVGQLDDGTPIKAELRTLEEIRLWEVSCVTFPAYESTEAALRSVGAALAVRGDDEATARRVLCKPELSRYALADHLVPAETTRGGTEQAPAETTPALSVAGLDLQLREYAALMGLPLD